jgi:hypothetical protein
LTLWAVFETQAGLIWISRGEIPLNRALARQCNYSNMRGLIITIVTVGFAGLIDTMYFGGTYSHAANEMLANIVQHIR